METFLQFTTTAYNLSQLEPGMKFIIAESVDVERREVHVVFQQNSEHDNTDVFCLSENKILNYSGDLLVIPVRILSMEIINTEL